MKVAIVGFGFMGEMHAQIYQALPGVELAAVVDINSTGANKRLAALGLDIPVYATLSALLEFCDVQVVDICSPTGQQIVNQLNHRVGIRIFGLTNCGLPVQYRRAMHATFNED